VYFLAIQPKLNFVTVLSEYGSHLFWFSTLYYNKYYVKPLCSRRTQSI